MSATAVTAAVVVAAGSTGLRVAYDPKITNKAPALFKVAAGGFILGAILTAIDSGAPNVAGILCLFIGVAALMMNATAITAATSHAFKK